MTIGRGLPDRWEAGFEVDPPHRGRGLRRALTCASRHLIPSEEAIFMQVAVGNVAPLRAILAAGFVQVASEILFVP